MYIWVTQQRTYKLTFSLAARRGKVQIATLFNLNISIANTRFILACLAFLSRTQSRHRLQSSSTFTKRLSTYTPEQWCKLAIWLCRKPPVLLGIDWCITSIYISVQQQRCVLLHKSNITTIQLLNLRKMQCNVLLFVLFDTQDRNAVMGVKSYMNNKCFNISTQSMDHW